MRRLLLLLCLAVFCVGARPAHANVLDRLLSWVTGSARTQGLSIAWNGTLRASTVELLDTKGTYATFHNVTIVWSPTQLIHRVLLVDSLTAEDGDIARLPESSGSSSSSSSKLAVKELSVGRLTLEKAVAGAEGTLKVSGSYSQDASVMEVMLAATRLDGNGTYNVNARLDPGSIDARVTAKEAAGGLIATAAGLPDVGSLDLTAAVSGPRNALGTSVALTAGELRAAAGGTVDLTDHTVAMHIAATAPAMAPRPGVAWQSVALNADAKGPFATPQMNGTMRIQGLQAEGGGAASVVLNASGDQGEVKLTGELDGVTVPGSAHDILASAPVRLEADARLSAPGKPVTFALNHPLIALNGTATLAPEHATVDVSLPDLAPFGAVAGQALAGQASLHITGGRDAAGVTTVALDGTVGITAGRAPVPALVGSDAKVALAARMQGGEVTISRLSFDGADLSLSGSGTASAAKVDLAFAAALAELAPIDPRLAGNLKMEGHVSGPTADLALASTLSGEVSMQGQSSGPFTAKLDAHGLPNTPSATLTAEGALLGSPIDVALSGERSPDGALHATITRASWKSLSGEGSVSLPAGATLPQGQLHVSIANLADFDPLLGRQLSGSVTAGLDAAGATWKVDAEADKADVPGLGSIGKAALHVSIDHPEDNPVADGTLALEGLRTSGISGSAHLTAKGPQSALALNLDADLSNLDGAPARAKAVGTASVPHRQLALSTFDAAWKGQTVRLLAPVRLGFAQGVSIDDLRLGIGRALIAVNGTVGQTLALNVRLRDVPAHLAKLASPSLDLSGTLNAEAKLGGTPSAPTGTVHATATALRLNTAQGKNLPAANVTANVDLRGTSTRIDLRGAAGGSNATVTGTAGLSTTAPLDLRANASLDIAQADPLLGGGTKATGRATLTAAITGTAAKPAGTVRVSANGVRVHGGVGAALPPASLTALATLNGGTARLDARLAAGSSHLTVAGTAGLSSTGPLDLRSTGVIDLALANPVLEAGGQSVRGRLAIDATARGTLAAPVLAGNATLSGGDVRDYANGVHLSDMTAQLVADGGVLRIVAFDARAGQGTMSARGTVGLLAPGIPVDLVITAHNATPIASDLMTATLGADLAIHGQAEGTVTLGGRVNVQRAVIQVPNKLPASVVTIPTRVAGAPPPKPKPPSKMLATIGLDLTVVAPRQIYVRGRGLNAELGGTVRIGGTTSAMRSSGGFQLIRGSFNLVGNTLNFTSGSIDFNGAAITDPALHLVATSVGSNMVATLTVGGTARDPKVTLSSVPSLPQDQILAQILFHTNSGALSPFQLASIAAGLAEISGHGGGLANPLSGLQNALGLDQLGIGTGANGQPTLQAGRYLNQRVYVGAQQAAGGGGAQGTVQVDLTKRLKLNVTVGSGEATSAIGSVGASSGESVGLTYQFEY